MPLERDLETVMNQIVTEMGHGGTMTAMMEEETVTTEEETATKEEENVIGNAMTTGTAGTMIEEVMTLVVVVEVVGPLAVASAAIMMTVGVAMIVTETGSAMVIVKTGMRDGMRGVKRELLSRDPS